MAKPTSIIFVVDDDSSVRRSIARLLKSAGHQVETFASAEEFLGSNRLDHSPACVVLDLRMPGLTGMDLQSRLNAIESLLPIIFITGHGDIPTSVRAMKEGAVDFLPKPFDDTQLLDAVERALQRNIREHTRRTQIHSIHERFATLTPREREVMALIATGKLNKQVADELGTVEKTIKVHRARIFEKMQVQTLAELVPLAEKIGLLE